MQNRQNQKTSTRPQRATQRTTAPTPQRATPSRATGAKTASSSAAVRASATRSRQSTARSGNRVRSLETRPSQAPGQARRRVPTQKSEQRRKAANANSRGNQRKVPDALPVQKHGAFSKLRDRLRKQPAITEIVREPTAGGIVFRFTPDQKDIEILLIQDTKNRWTIPKGHIEPGETAKQTAIREIGEEAGLFHIQALTWLGKIHFKYRRIDKLVLMTTQIYLVRSLDKAEAPTKEKWMHGIQWFSFTDALEAIEYEDIEKLILIAKKKIRNGEV